MTKLEGKQRNNDLKVKCEDYPVFMNIEDSLREYYDVIPLALDCVVNDGRNDENKVSFKSMSRRELLRHLKLNLHSIITLIPEKFVFTYDFEEVLILTVEYENYIKFIHQYVNKVNKAVIDLKMQFNRNDIEFKVIPYNPDCYDITTVPDLQDVKTRIEIAIPNGKHFPTLLSFTI